MMDKLTIFWHDKAAESFYWTLDNSKSLTEANAIHHLESHELLKADLAGLADTAHGKKIELVLSSNDVHFNFVNLPNKAQRHLRKAVPFLLEEQLSEPVDNIFIAIGERQKDNLIPVRGINLKYLHELVDAFKLAEINLDCIRVDLDLLDSPEVGFRLALIDDRVLMVDENNKKWNCALADFFWLSQRIVEQQLDEELPVAIPLSIVCDNEEAFNEFSRQLPVGQFAPLLERVSSVEEKLTSSKQARFNLLQAEFEPKSESSPIRGVLLKVASLAGIIFATHLVYQGTQLFWLNTQANILQDHKVELWKQAFPGRKVPSSQDRELRSYLKSLEGGKGDGAFLAMLNSTSALITDLDKLYPTNISYSAARSELRIDLIAKDLPVLNQYRDDLKNAGFEVDMSSATQRGDGYSSRLVIRRT